MSVPPEQQKKLEKARKNIINSTQHNCLSTKLSTQTTFAKIYMVVMIAIFSTLDLNIRRKWKTHSVQTEQKHDEQKSFIKQVGHVFEKSKLRNHTHGPIIIMPN